MSERIETESCLRGSKLECAPTEIPVVRALALQAQMMTSFDGIAYTGVRQTDPRRRGLAILYETLPLASRNQDDMFDNQDSPDQSLHMTIQFKKPHPRHWRMAVMLQQYESWPHRTATNRQQFAVEWQRGDRFLAGSRRDIVFSSLDTNDQPPRLPKTGLNEDGLFVEVSESELIVETTERPLVVDDIDLLARHVLTCTTLKSQQNRHQLP